MSTYKRPELLKKQLHLLLQQKFPDFEIIVSDNDPEASAQNVSESFKDSRIRYFHNSENFGMIKSFNKSIVRASAEHIVMVTDDDPVDPVFLATFYELYKDYPLLSIYCGFKRLNRPPGEIEKIESSYFIKEVLDPRKTSNLLWSSAIVKKKDAIQIGLIPDYGSPHLADHAFIAMAGSINGGIVLNNMYSTLSFHSANFSKFNFHYYVNGCSGFYHKMIDFSKSLENFDQIKKVIIKHLGWWFLATFFTAKKYYTLEKQDPEMLKNISKCARQILAMPFMKKFSMKYYSKQFIFFIKRTTRLLKRTRVST